MNPIPPQTPALYLEQEKPLSDLSTFRIGGKARLFTTVHTIQELQEALLYAQSHQIPFFILGKGSNSLFHDKGFNGLVIANRINFCEREGTSLFVGAGYSFSLLGTQTARDGLSGLEFASGIPGSVGGAIYMNAGANGSETCETLESVTFVTPSGEIQELGKSELSFSYRHSSFHEKKGGIAAARFTLTPSTEARKKQLSIIEYRTRTQPYGDPSAGCIFRNPTGHSAGALIEKSGLKGMKVGGAEVSLLHANFIVNRESASASDVQELALLVKKQVKEKTGIDLEMEVRCIPYEGSFNV